MTIGLLAEFVASRLSRRPRRFLWIYQGLALLPTRLASLTEVNGKVTAFSD